MTSMEDLIATISGGMHVSQEGYDLKALQEYLSRTIVMPNVMTPGGAYGYAPGPSSRARSMTRKQPSLPTGPISGSINSNIDPASASLYATTELAGEMMYQPYPSPIATVQEDPLPQPHRPASLRRSSSYGFGNTPSSPYMEYSSFESDAFAPLVQGQEAKSANIWGAPEKGVGKSNPWAAFQNGGAFGNQWAGKSARDAKPSTMAHGVYRPPTPPDEDDEMMDEDEIDGAIDEEEHQEQAQIPPQTASSLFGMPGVDERIAEQMKHDWERGRRKE